MRLTLATCVLTLAAFAQTAPEASFSVETPGKKIALTAADLAAMPRISATVTIHGTATKYDGVLLRDILHRASAPSGDELKGKALATVLLVTARDGYQVAFTLAELDDAYSHQRVMVADTANGAKIPADQGPFRLIVPDDAKPARSVRMLSRIQLLPVVQ